jgi:protein-S-isoprenylcysteine O-methyltransferase Ste14
LHPGVILIGTLAAAALLENKVPAPLPIQPLVRKITAGVVMTLSAVGLFWGLKTLQDNKTTAEPNQEPSAIATNGHYRYSRNPMYVSAVGMSLGWTFLMSSAWFLAATIVFFLLLNTFVIPGEEARLERKFPAAFEEWSRRTRRWI